ncbi:MAG: alpha/beta hydrolase [Planctomycetota bacterium]|jgi:S-formylglutathione hydrolase FrmB
MAVCEIHFGNANALGKMISATVILPEGKGGPFPVLYLLHGLSDDHTTWVRRTSIERYVEGIPLIVVMPNGERSFYTDSRSNPKAAFETMIVRDLVGFVDETLNTVPERSGRATCGLSMGGYGALKLALKHPDTFCAASSHSGALMFASRPLDARGKDEEWLKEFVPVFGEDPSGGPEDVLALAEKAARNEHATLPALRIDCGTEDFLIADNRDAHARLEELGVPHEYHEFPGAHEWGYWDVHVRESIEFVARAMGMAG